MEGKTKKVPMRMCVGCREMREKKSLVRIVRSADGIVRIDKTGKSNGRGAYICKNEGCLEKAIKSKAIDRALGIKTDEQMQKELAEAIQNECKA